MIKKSRIYSFLLNNAYKEIHQATIHSICKCTPAYTCRIIKKLKKKKIVIKNFRNSVFVVNPLMLAFLIAYEKKKTQPLLYKTPNFKDTLSILNQTIYSLTFESALKIKKSQEPKIIHAYVLGKDISILNSNFTKTKKDPDLIVYPSDHFNFIHQQLVSNIFLASDYDIFIDLLSKAKINKALNFAKKYKLFKHEIF